MRKEFAFQLEQHMEKDENIFLLTGDLGFGILDNIKNKFSDRFMNVGAAEHLLIGAAIGLAEEGKIPIAYSISPFLIFRPFELIRNFINYESIPIKMVGSGRDKDYVYDGITHWADDIPKFLNLFENIKCYHPITKDDLDLNEFLYNNKPCYLNLKR